jgi:magnesium-transporting ATPase (P-type)
MNLTYHQLPAKEVMSDLSSNMNGLTNEEVLERRKQHGPNAMPQPKSKTLAEIFIHQFLNPLIYVLIIAAIVSVAIGDMKDAIFITAVIVFNAVLGTYQEWRAENSAMALRNLVKVKCRVRRNGIVHQVDSEELVPGDIVILESGQKVPADLRLIEANDLSVEEALLTGESVAVSKSAEALQNGSELSIGDRVNMAFAATIVQRGRGTGIVVGTAKNTEIGQIADSLRTTGSQKPPLVKRMESFSKKISLVILIICFLLGIMGFVKGMPLEGIIFLMIAVGVAAIPEGLPIGLTVALSIGTRRMARRNVIVRKLPAVEGLGSCTLIASDKTGTLTMDQQSVKKLWLPGEGYYEVTGQGYNGEGKIVNNASEGTEMSQPLYQLVLASVMANESELRKTQNNWEHSGDAVDVAFKALAYKAGSSPEEIAAGVQLKKMIPYESENQFSAAYYEQDGQLHFAMKGAVEVILRKIPENEREPFLAITEELAADGYRVLAVAGGLTTTTDISDLPKLKMYGLIGMIDPLRAEAKDAVDQCTRAGIEVVMVTGDHPSTALAIAKELGIATDRKEIITGSELSGMDNLSVNELGNKLRSKKVFARVAPLQKQMIVEAKKSLGHFVAVTGDGANDAPALKSAHIGVAMGGGTDLAKEASSIIITDNNFASIAAGVEEGRFVFDNLRKIIYLLISSGAAALLTIGLAIITNVPLPFLPVQLLWLNLVTNGIQDVALAFEKGDKAVMQKPPRNPNESIFDKQMVSQVVLSGVYIGALVFGLWYHIIYNLNLDEVHGRTITMMLMVLLQNFHVLNCRSETKSVFNVPMKNNYVLIIGMALAQLLHISASYIPGLKDALQLIPVSFSEWIKLLPTAASVLVLMEVFKWWRRRGEKQ